MSQHQENQTEHAGFTPNRTPKGTIGVTPDNVKDDTT